MRSEQRPVVDLSYTEASAELDAIVRFFEQRDVDVDQLVTKLERATAIVDELDRRLRRTRAQVEELVPRLSASAEEFGDDHRPGDGARGDAVVADEIVDDIVDEELDRADRATEVIEDMFDSSRGRPPERRPGHKRVDPGDDAPPELF